MEVFLANLFASAIPNAEDIEVELCAAPNGSYSLSDLFVKPDNPLPCLNVLIFFFQAEDGIRDSVASRGLGDVYKRQL